MGSRRHHRRIAIALVFVRLAAGSLCSAQDIVPTKETTHYKKAASENREMEGQELTVVAYWNENGVSLRMSVTGQSLPRLFHKDFGVRVYDSLKEEVPCQPEGSDSFLAFANGTQTNASGFWKLSLNPDRVPVSAVVSYQGKEHPFTLKIQDNPQKP